MTFNGFISYSHAADGRLAPAVQHGLHRLAKPWHRRRALWIFRDQTGLSVTPGLWSSIQTALDGSEYFVLLASPEAARSKWVNREIEHWVATKSPDRILPVVTDGDWRWDPALRDFAEDSTAVPAALRGVFAEEPLFLDLRWARDDRHLSLQHSRFRDAIAQLAAPMHGVSKDDLEGEDVRHHRRARRLRSVAVAALVVLTLVASLTGVLAVRNADRANAAAAEARHQQQVASEQRGSAERSAEESRRQSQNAQQQEARAKDAAAETRRQEQLAQKQQGLATKASVEARRQQKNARRQQQLANRAAELAQEQEKVAREQQELAQESAGEARRQKRIAQEQLRLAKDAAEDARQQKQNAERQQRLARDAAEEARREKANAEQQQRIAISRRLVNRAKATIDRDPRTALMLGAAAQKIRPDAEIRTELTGLVTSTHYAGSLSGVTEVMFGPKNLLVATGPDGDVSLWNVADRARPLRVAAMDDALRWPALSPDGRTLALSDTSGSVILWDVTRRARPVRIATLRSGSERASATFSPDRRTIAVQHSDSTGIVTTLWDVTVRTRPRPLSTLTGGGRYAFSPDGRTLVTGNDVWDVSDRGKPVRLGEVGARTDGPMVFSPTAPMLAIGGKDGSVVLWDMTDPARPQQRTLVDKANSTIYSIAFSADGRVLAALDSRGAATLSDVTARTVWRLATVTSPGGARSVALSDDGRTLATVRTDGTATMWNVGTYGALRPLSELTGHGGELLAAAFGPGGRSMATAGGEGAALFWDLRRPARPVRRAIVSTGDGRTNAVAFGRDMRTVAAAQLGGKVTLRDVSNPARPVTLAVFDANADAIAIQAMAFSPDGRTLATVTGSDRTMLWDLADRTRPVRVATLPGGSTVAFSPDGRTLAVNKDGRMVALWNVNNPAAPVQLSLMAGHELSVTSMAFSPDGRTLATGSHDRTAMLWDVTDRARPRRLTTLTAHNNEVGAVAFSPDGHTLATFSGDDQTAMLWDVTDRADPLRLGSFRLESQRVRIVNSVVFSPDGRSLAVAGYHGFADAAVALWDHTDLNKLRADPARAACAITGRGLTADEWARHIPELRHQRTCPR